MGKKLTESSGNSGLTIVYNKEYRFGGAASLQNRKQN